MSVSCLSHSLRDSVTVKDPSFVNLVQGTKRALSFIHFHSAQHHNAMIQVPELELLQNHQCNSGQITQLMRQMKFYESHNFHNNYYVREGTLLSW